jgi:hypothetical protein
MLRSAAERICAKRQVMAEADELAVRDGMP